MNVTVGAQKNWHEFVSRDELARSLAATVADRLDTAIEARGGAVLAVSGGSTPALFFDHLSRHDLAWRKVVVTLVDERFVPPSSERSNEHLVRARLLQNEARLARFVPLYTPAANAEEAARAADAGIALLGQPLDVVVLGMGGDGHTASFFPDAANLPALTDPGAKARVLPVHAPSAVEPRLTLTLPLIAKARFLALHIEGGDKRAVLDRALSDPTEQLPIRTVIDHAATPIHIFWAPSEEAKP